MESCSFFLRPAAYCLPRARFRLLFTFRMRRVDDQNTFKVLTVFSLGLMHAMITLASKMLFS
jgi:hypothetical protein